MKTKPSALANSSRRRFMTGAAGLTFGVAIATPGLQNLAVGMAEAATGSVRASQARSIGQHDSEGPHDQPGPG